MGETIVKAIIVAVIILSTTYVSAQQFTPEQERQIRQYMREQAELENQQRQQYLYERSRVYEGAVNDCEYYVRTHGGRGFRASASGETSNTYGTEYEQFAFRKCMNEKGIPIISQ